MSNNTLNNLIQYHVQGEFEERVAKVQTVYQMGFTAKIPVTHAVVAREEIQALSECMGRTLIFGVLDLKSCFPRICRENLLHLASTVLTTAQWMMLKQIYTETFQELRVGGKRTKVFERTSGTIEGGVLSVQLLKLYLHVLQILEKDNRKRGADIQAQMAVLCVEHIRYLYLLY